MSDIRTYAELIRNGGLVAFPTETVYGLGASAFDPDAIERVFLAKGRPSDNPLIVHISSIEQLRDFAVTIPDQAFTLTEQLWPGPLTLVLPKKPGVLDRITAGLSTVAVRMPDHPLALELISQSGPLVAPSANRSGRPSPTKAAHVHQDFGEQIPVLDGGETRLGLESTVLDLSNDTISILRPGSISRKQIEALLNTTVQERFFHSDGAAKSPGQKYSHYKPVAEVRWIADLPDTLKPDTLYLAAQDLPEQPHLISYQGDLNRMARELYDRFRFADHKAYRYICIQEFELRQDDISTALKNRIDRAVSL